MYVVILLCPWSPYLQISANPKSICVSFCVCMCVVNSAHNSVLVNFSKRYYLNYIVSNLETLYNIYEISVNFMQIIFYLVNVT